MEAATSQAGGGGRAKRLEEPETHPDLCSRPACRKEFRRVLGPGRGRAYCSDFCRRAAERELRQVKSRLARFERLVEMLRNDLAAFGKQDSDGADDGKQSGPDQMRLAEDAIHRAAGALLFASSNEPAVQELQNLYDAVAPVIMSRRKTG